MSIRNRESLKNYFAEGALPTEEHFADLIDSMLNMTDEGFSKTVENGFEIYAPFGYGSLISFFRDTDPKQAVWKVNLSSAEDQLLVQSSTDTSQREQALETVATPSPLLCLDRAQRIGVHTTTPEVELDVNGVLRANGRRGAYHLVPADGNWHDLKSGLRGCQAFEVVAGAGHRGEGRFGMIHAVALNTYNPTLGIFDFLNRKRGIRCTHAYYGRRCDRLELRWIGSSGRNGEYRLQIRTACSFAPDYKSPEASKDKNDDKNFPIQIQAHVSELWFDPHMDLGQKPNPSTSSTTSAGKS